MPSLKDLRNRIAATKATQKITKAMQMVAASKLRRAQAAAEAARPYASRMDTVLGNIAASVAAPTRRRGFCKAPAAIRASPSGLHRRTRPVRPIQHRDRAARTRARQCAYERRQKRSSSSAVGRRATTVAKTLCAADCRTGRPALGAHAGLRKCRDDRREDHRAVRQVRIRCLAH